MSGHHSRSVISLSEKYRACALKENVSEADVTSIFKSGTYRSGFGAKGSPALPAAIVVLGRYFHEFPHLAAIGERQQMQVYNKD